MTDENAEVKSKDNFNKLKAGFYGINYAGGVIGNTFHWAARGPLAKFSGNLLEKLGVSHQIANPGMANPVGAIAYGGWDIARNYFNLKETLASKIVDGATAAYYGVSFISDLFGLLKGEGGSLVQLPFDFMMLYASGKNLKEDFSIDRKIIPSSY